MPTRLIAMYTFHRRRGSDEEVIDEGDIFEADATRFASADEHARHMIARHTARLATPEEIQKAASVKGIMNFGPQSYGKRAAPAQNARGR